MKFKSIISEYDHFSDRLNETAKEYTQPIEQEISIAKSKVLSELNLTNTICYLKSSFISINTHLGHHARDFHIVLFPDSIVFTEISKIIRRCRAINELLFEGSITPYPYNNQTYGFLEIDVILVFEDCSLSFRVEFDKNDIPYNDINHHQYFSKFKLQNQKPLN